MGCNKRMGMGAGESGGWGGGGGGGRGAEVEESTTWVAQQWLLLTAQAGWQCKGTAADAAAVVSVHDANAAWAGQA